MSVADYHVRDRQDVAIKKDMERKIEYQHSSLPCSVEQIEVSCGEKRESVPVQVVNRRWRLRGGRGGEREVRRESKRGWEREEMGEGCYSHYIMNEVRSHIFAVEALFILFYYMLERLTSAPLCTQSCPAILVGTYCKSSFTCILYRPIIITKYNANILVAGGDLILWPGTHKYVILVKAASVFFFFPFSVYVCINTRWV